jgi:hypothetical protein
MKKTIGKNLVCILLVSTFLFPLIGNTATADVVTCDWWFTEYLTSECWGTNPVGMVNGIRDGDLGSFASESRHCITEHLYENEYDEEYEYEILYVYLQVFGYHTGDNEALGITPVFNNMTEGDTHVIYLPDGYDNRDWSVWINITDDLESHLQWTWEDIENLDCHVTTGCNTQSFTLYVAAVRILVTFIV